MFIFINYFIEMIEDVNEDLNENDPELISYSTTTRGGEQMIYLNKVYQIKKKIETLHGYFI